MFALNQKLSWWKAEHKCAHVMHTSSNLCSNWGWLWLSMLSLPLHAKFSDLCINLPQYQLLVVHSEFQKYILFTPKKYAYNQVQGKDIHKSACKTFVWRVMRTYPHRTHQMVMWHLHLLVPHQVFSFLWQQHWTLPASHLSQHH